jgi:DNA-binding FrmR family transcriptional regulator
MKDAKQKTLVGLKKAQGLLSRVIKMAEKDEYCINIMQQNLAVIGLLKSAHAKLLENHLNTCFKRSVGASNEKRKQKMIEEIIRMAKLYNK